MTIYTPITGWDQYAKLTAQTGIASLTTANSNLDGSGALVSILSAGTNGTVLRSVMVKATQAVTVGMVRLFIRRGNKYILIKEINVLPTPSFSATPTPVPLCQTFVYYLPCSIFLESGDILFGSTQNSENFNVFAEALDIGYPTPTPTVPSNFIEEYPNTGVDIVSVANANLDGTGTIAAVYTSASSVTYNGSVIKAVSISALESVVRGMVRFFISPDNGTTYYLFNEIYIPDTVASPIVQTFSVKFSQYFNLQADYIIGVSTENSEKFAISIQGIKWKYGV